MGAEGDGGRGGIWGRGGRGANRRQKWQGVAKQTDPPALYADTVDRESDFPRTETQRCSEWTGFCIAAVILWHRLQSIPICSDFSAQAADLRRFICDGSGWV